MKLRTLFLLALGIAACGNAEAQVKKLKQISPRLDKEMRLSGTDSLTISIAHRSSPQFGRARLLGSRPDAGIYTLRIARRDLSLLLADTAILFADMPVAPKEEITTGALDITLNTFNRSHHVYPGVMGDSIRISIKEQRFDTADIDLRNRYFSSGQEAAGATTHAGVMATLMAGAGNTTPEAKGGAPAALLTSATFTNLLPQTDSLYKRYNISIQNHSYGTAVENYYGNEAAAFDAAALANKELLFVFSSGNSGTTNANSGAYAGLPVSNLTGNFKMAKNNLVVGAVDSFANVAPLSSRGPAHDGRVKPELVAFGQDGSSGAAALVSGAAALVQDAYKESKGLLPPAALVKAVLINSARDSASRNLNYRSGYGNLNAFGAVQTVRHNRIATDSLTNGITRSFPMVIPAGIRRVKITLAWHDRPGVVNAPRALVNDLDALLRLPSTGETWMPWVLNHAPNVAAINAPPQRKTDTLNNVEQITLDDPLAGNYILEIKGTRITGTQSFSIAWQLDTLDKFSWSFPTASDKVEGGKQAVLRWETSIASAGAIELSVNGGSWMPVTPVADLSAHYVKWQVPDTFAIAQLRMRPAGLPEIYSDSFVISRGPSLSVGFDCTDSLLLTWNRQPVDSFILFGLGNRYLLPLFVVRDTFIVLSKNDHPFVHFSLAPIVKNSKGRNGTTVKTDAQGVGCYFRSFYINGQSDGNVSFLASLGSLYRVAQLSLQKMSGTGFITRKSISPVTSLVYNFTDSYLTRGINRYRLELVLDNGARLYSEIISVFHYPDVPVIVFPNPMSQGSAVQLLSQEPGKYHVDVYDAVGRLLQTARLMDLRNTLRFLSLSKGIYFITIRDEHGLVDTQKLVVQ